MAMTQTDKAQTALDKAKAKEDQERAVQLEKRAAEDPASATPSDEAKALPQNHPHKGDKPSIDHVDGGGTTDVSPGERDGRGEYFDQDRSPKSVDYRAPNGPNEDIFSGSVQERK